MKPTTKQLQLQIRVSKTEKTAIQQAAKAANLGMSEWVLSKLLPSGQRRFQDLTRQLAETAEPGYILAEIHDLLKNATPSEFEEIAALPISRRIPPYLENYIAAMIEYSAHQKKVSAPEWVRQIPPLDSPHFPVDMLSLRLYLLTHSPAPYRNRNIFIDAPIGTRV